MATVLSPKRLNRAPKLETKKRPNSKQEAQHPLGLGFRVKESAQDQLKVPALISGMLLNLQ